MLSRNAFIISIVIGSLLLCGCSTTGLTDMLPSFTPGTKVVDDSEMAAKYRPDLPDNTSGLLASVRVADFIFDQGSSASGEYTWKDSSGRTQSYEWNFGAKTQTGEAMATLLESAMSATGHYLVNVRGETLDAAKEENDLANEGWVGDNEIEKGQMQSPDLMIKATLLEYCALS